ncbi:MAG TPA: PIN domain-containing protein [Candidatus Dojkabacteria bacterium]
MKIIDTSVLFAYFNTSDSQHQKALKILNEIIAHEEVIMISSTVVLEIVTLNSIRKLNIKQMENFIEDLLQDKVSYFQYYYLSEKDFKTVLFDLRKIQKPLSLVDYSLIYLSQKNKGAEVISFNRDLLKSLI